MYNVSPVVVQMYAQKHGLSHKEAREKLRENYEKEFKTIDPREIALRAIDSARQTSSKVAGLEAREKDYTLKIKLLIENAEQTIFYMQQLKSEIEDLRNNTFLNKLKCLIYKIFHLTRWNN